MCDEKMSEREKNKYHLRRRRRCYFRSHHSERNNTELKAETHRNKVPSMMVSCVCFSCPFQSIIIVWLNHLSSS